MRQRDGHTNRAATRGPERVEAHPHDRPRRRPPQGELVNAVLDGDVLATVGVPSRPYFNPLHLQPLYRERFGHGPGDFPVTERIAASTLALPWSPKLADDDVAYVAEQLISAIRSQTGG